MPPANLYNSVYQLWVLSALDNVGGWRPNTSQARNVRVSHGAIHSEGAHHLQYSQLEPADRLALRFPVICNLPRSHPRIESVYDTSDHGGSMLPWYRFQNLPIRDS